MTTTAVTPNMTVAYKRTRITLDSDGLQLVGYLYTPASYQGKLPCIIMVSGFGATQDVSSIVASASGFAEAGFAALTIDYRHFGESEGQPRQVIKMKGQRRDVKAALEWVRAQPNLDADRVALWGTSLGGTHMIFVAAEEERIAAVVAQIPYSGRPKETVGRTPQEARRIMRLAVLDLVRGWLGLKPLYVPIVGTGAQNAVLVDPHVIEMTRHLTSNNSHWRNEVAPRVIFDILRLSPLSVAKQVRAPLLVTIAEKDTEAPIYLTRQLAELAPRGETQVYPVTHYEMYRPEIRAQVFADQLAFLKKHLM